MKTISVLGTPLAVTDYGGAIECCKAVALLREQTFCVAAANTHVVALARHQPEYARTLQAFDLILPDGMPLVWAMNSQLAAPLSDRVYGPTFMLRCLEATQGESWSHLFVGGSEELLATLSDQLRTKFPKLQIAGVYSPPFGEWPADEHQKIIERIRASGARFIWFGLGCPKQENWLAQYKSQLPVGVYCAVGAAFAFHAGRVRQAPLLLQRFGLEWIFRLLMEPRRLFRRYFVYNSLFIFYRWRERFAQ